MSKIFANLILSSYIYIEESKNEEWNIMPSFYDLTNVNKYQVAEEVQKIMM